MTIDEIFLALLTGVILLAARVREPTRARCPSDWWLSTGIQRDGTFRCARPMGRHEEAPAPGYLGGHIYCTGGSIPIVVDERTVGCQHRAGS